MEKGSSFREPVPVVLSQELWCAFDAGKGFRSMEPNDDDWDCYRVTLTQQSLHLIPSAPAVHARSSIMLAPFNDSFNLGHRRASKPLSVPVELISQLTKYTLPNVPFVLAIRSGSSSYVYHLAFDSPENLNQWSNQLRESITASKARSLQKRYMGEALYASAFTTLRRDFLDSISISVLAGETFSCSSPLDPRQLIIHSVKKHHFHLLGLFAHLMEDLSVHQGRGHQISHRLFKLALALHRYLSLLPQDSDSISQLQLACKTLFLNCAGLLDCLLPAHLTSFSGISPEGTPQDFSPAYERIDQCFQKLLAMLVATPPPHVSSSHPSSHLSSPSSSHPSSPLPPSSENHFQRLLCRFHASVASFNRTSVDGAASPIPQVLSGILEETQSLRASVVIFRSSSSSS
ncbi:MAG: hypothetical protein Q8P67_22750, partial [archaeon]|nr:hypothetical protein [archaeon]